MAIVAAAVVVGRTRLAMSRPLGVDAVVLPVVVTVVCVVVLAAVVAVAVVVGRTRLAMPRPRGAVAVVPPVVVTVACGVAPVAVVAAAVGVIVVCVVLVSAVRSERPAVRVLRVVMGGTSWERGVSAASPPCRVSRACWRRTGSRVRPGSHSDSPSAA